jgi:hypothetical protein
VRPLAYGPAALADGRPQQFLTGALVVPGPAMYPFVIALLVFGVGFLERRVGAMRAGAVLLGSYLIASIGSSALVLSAATLGLPWAHAMAQISVTGLSAGP